MTFQFKFINDNERIFVPPRNTRNNIGRNFIIQPYKTKRAYTSPYWEGPRLWASLPLDIRNEDNKIIFKRKFKKYSNTKYLNET